MVDGGRLDVGSHLSDLDLRGHVADLSGHSGVGRGHGNLGLVSDSLGHLGVSGLRNEAELSSSRHFKGRLDLSGSEFFGVGELTHKFEENQHRDNCEKSTDHNNGPESALTDVLGLSGHPGGLRQLEFAVGLVKNGVHGSKEGSAESNGVLGLVGLSASEEELASVVGFFDVVLGLKSEFLFGAGEGEFKSGELVDFGVGALADVFGTLAELHLVLDLGQNRLESVTAHELSSRVKGSFDVGISRNGVETRNLEAGSGKLELGSFEGNEFGVSEQSLFFTEDQLRNLVVNVEREFAGDGFVDDRFVTRSDQVSHLLDAEGSHVVTCSEEGIIVLFVTLQLQAHLRKSHAQQQ